MDDKIKAVILCGKGQSSRIMYNGIAFCVKIECVILENKPSSKILLQRRMIRLGILKVIGQVAFILVNRVLGRFAKARVNKLILNYKLDDTSPPINITKNVSSVNNEGTINLLKKFNPDVVVVNGTRIISNKVLSSIDAPFINTHMGVTPKYRGVHGGYWALANGDPDNCGVTVHLVDQGIDTGGVLYQDTIIPDKYDNFNTYPIHQIAKAIPLMKAVLNDVKENSLNIKQGISPSHLWYHPTLFEYMKNWIRRGVK